MRSFKNYEDLLTKIGAECKSDFAYGNNQLNTYLESNGSDEGDEPYFSFKLEFNSIIYVIGVTHKEVEEDVYSYTYWLMDIENLNGRNWKDVKHVLDKYSVAHDCYFDSTEGIVDFTDIYSDFSIAATVTKSSEETVVNIDDMEVVYINN